MDWLDKLVDQIVAMPPWAAWLAIVCATFVSEDLTCVAAGLTAATGRMSAFTAVGAAGLGIWIGDLGLYLLGKWVGVAALRRAPISWFMHEEDVEASAKWFRHRGARVILVTRFVPGTRLPTYFASGLVSAGFWRFALYTAIAVAIWAPILGGGTVLLGRQVLPLIHAYNRWALLVVVLAAIAYLFAVKILIPSFTWRGRRMIVSRYRRITRWEFWPPWLFYPPVLAYIAWLAVKHRSLSVFTAVNPAVHAGGFIGESKSEILARLCDAPEFVAHTRRVDASLDTPARMQCVLDFMREHALDFPLVLKPDAGQRGSGVAVVRSEAEIATYVSKIRVDCVAQEHVPGEEFGVFYYRLPDQPRGRIFSITRKVFPRIHGDGVRTIERLILEDARAVCMAKRYLHNHRERLWDVLAPGEELQLVEIGNHCLGAVFLDGCELATPELEAAIERISRGFEGFYFGRYDLRVASTEALRAGRDFKVIELNGATSEATHIYDPRHGLLFAYRVLFEQWRILFAIAAQNVERGAQVVRVPDLLRLLSRYRVAARSHPS